MSAMHSQRNALGIDAMRSPSGRLALLTARHGAETVAWANRLVRIDPDLYLIADSSQRGFYGEAGLTLSVQDGRIQHIRVAVERMIK